MRTFLIVCWCFATAFAVPAVAQVGGSAVALSKVEQTPTAPGTGRMTLPANTSSGWAFIASNDFRAARAAFEAALKHDPDDEASLLGLLFIAETLQDEPLYLDCANRLLVRHWAKPADEAAAAFTWLFGHLWKGLAAEALRQTEGLPTAVRLPFMMAQADTLFHYRRFNESKALALQMFPDWNWTIAGPFTNVAGSGFLEPTSIETLPFDPKARFKNEEGLEFGWLRRVLRQPGAPVDFPGLPSQGNLRTLYANTFITVPTTRRVTLGISRQEPMKIWLDDQLLVSLPDPAPSESWDEEKVTFTLPAGTHRLLVKMADLPGDPVADRLHLDYYDQPNTYENDYIADEEDDDRWAGGHTLNRLAGSAFALRFTQPESPGRLFPDISADFTGQYAPAAQAFSPECSKEACLTYFTRTARGAPNALWDQYLLAKAFARSGKTEVGEEYFTQWVADRPNLAFGRFLLAKFYDADGKGERAEALLSELDTAATPTFAEHYERMSGINQQQDEMHYISALEGLLRLSPSNWSVLSRYLRFLKEKGRKDQVKSYVQEFLEKHRDDTTWERRLAKYLKDESYKPASYQPPTDRERAHNYKSARKETKKMFKPWLYSEMLGWLKHQDRTEEALRLYDEWLSIMPWAVNLRYEKAAFLFEKNRPEEALALLRDYLDLSPYDARVHELMGDIFVEKKADTAALRCYRLAEKCNGENSYGLADKIEKIENRATYAGLFESLDLAELAKDRSWKSAQNAGADQESVISHFAQQVTYLPERHKAEVLSKAVIHILSDAGAKRWTEADLRPLGNVTSAKVLKKDGAITSPELGWSMAVFKNLQAGDIILLEGAADSEMPDEIPGEFLYMTMPTWPAAPVARATLELLTPKGQPVYAAAHRLDTSAIRHDTLGFTLRRWEWRNLSRTEDNEDATPDNLDQSAWLMLGSTPDWGKVVQWYQRKTYRRTAPNYEVTAQAQALLRPGMNQQEVVQTLHDFVTQQVNYSYVPFLNSNYVPKKPGATLSGKVGDCKDVATLMIALLREQGIPAWYTLVSTHSFSEEEPRPTLYVFNHAIVAYQLADSVLRFADLTTDYFPAGILPQGDCAAWALVIRDGETALRRLPDHALDSAFSRVEIRADASVDREGNLRLQVDQTRHGVAAGHWREQIHRNTAEERQKHLSEYFGGGVLTHLDLDDIAFQNLDSLNEPLKGQVTLSAFHQLDAVAGLRIMPLPLPLSTPTQKGLFAANRSNDLDLDEWFELSPVREVVDLTLPSGYELAEMPRERHFSSRFGAYALSFERTSCGLRLRREASFRQRFVRQEDFQDFKKFYLDMLDADDMQLALRKTR